MFSQNDIFRAHNDNTNSQNKSNIYFGEKIREKIREMKRKGECKNYFVFWY